MWRWNWPGAVFAVAVIVGWLLALLWLSISVTQIVVDHTVVSSCQVAEPRVELTC